MRVMFKRHRNEVNSIAFSPDGRSLASGSDDCSIYIWNLRDGSARKLPATDDAGFFASVVFSPDGRYIAAGDLKKSLWIWNSRTHKLVASWKGHRDSVWCVEFTPDGKGLMSGSTDMEVNYWDVSSLRIHEVVSGREVMNSRPSFPFIPSRTLTGHTVSIFFLLHCCTRHLYLCRGPFTLLRSFPATVN